mmetsp:Transcript_64277/g.140911  ORF Transcript_64277/g.140911 Transcript_64277/m.140911 type:complete len:205 (+) Transcript_64277:444-1058(+)
MRFPEEPARTTRFLSVQIRQAHRSTNIQKCEADQNTPPQFQILSVLHPQPFGPLLGPLIQPFRPLFGREVIQGFLHFFLGELPQAFRSTKLTLTTDHAISTLAFQEVWQGLVFVTCPSAIFRFATLHVLPSTTRLCSLHGLPRALFALQDANAREEEKARSASNDTAKHHLPFRQARAIQGRRTLQVEESATFGLRGRSVRSTR